jgi:hypothetical protein
MKGTFQTNKTFVYRNEEKHESLRVCVLIYEPTTSEYEAECQRFGDTINFEVE